MKKQPKEARIRYMPPRPGISNFEGFNLEVYDPEFGWSLVAFAPLRYSVDFPDAPEKDFIHWSLVKTMCDWILMGYNIRYVGEITEEES